MACDARQYSDEMKCGKCGLSWDVNDPEPPTCQKPRGRAKSAVIAFEAERADGGLKFPIATNLPAELPRDIAAEMFRHLQYARGTGSDGVAAMQRAYRIFLDWLP